MSHEWLKTRQTKYGAYVTVYILVIVAVLAAVNFLANRYDKSYDSTANKQFSLSDQTIKLVKNLKTDVKLYYFDDATRFELIDVFDRFADLRAHAYEHAEERGAGIVQTDIAHEQMSAGLRGGRG